MTQKLDIILFGATGFTGKYCIPVIAKFSTREDRHLTWGIAGRSEEKLRDLLSHHEEETGHSLLNNVSIIVADVKDEDSLRSMARQARIIINCCGPFRFFGEAVVKACIAEGSHHVDVSGEIQYMEEMQLKYHKKAEEKGVYIISACGYESIPIDLGVVLLQEKFPGTLNSVEAYLKFWEEGVATGPSFNFGTWESLLLVLAYAKELKSIRRQLFAKKLPNLKPKLKTKLLPHQADLVGGWPIPFHATDRPVINRTQRLFYEEESKRPVQIETYLVMKSFLHVIIMALGALMLLTLTKFSAGLKLLLKYPEKCTFGFVSRQPPSEKKVRNTHFSITLRGRGWAEKFSSPDYQFPTGPDKTIVANITGSNPFYGVSALCMVLSAITILTENDKMPSRGGVLPPGYAFAKTSLLQQIDKNGVKFEILYG